MMKRRDVLALAAGAAAACAEQPAPAFTLPKLPYRVDAFEPYLDAQTMEIHHGKHHQAYVDNLNRALSGYPELARRPIEALLRDWRSLPDAIRTAVRNHGGGHANHSLFWQVLGKSSQGPKGELARAITRSFSSREAMLEKIHAAGLSVFGSGWVWVTPARDGRLAVETSPNQDNPWMAARTPLLGVDVWEHAYYLKYQNRRGDYLTAVLQLLNWEFLSERYERILAAH